MSLICLPGMTETSSPKRSMADRRLWNKKFVLQRRLILCFLNCVSWVTANGFGLKLRNTVKSVVAHLRQCRHWLTDDSQWLKLRNAVKSVVAHLSVVTDWLMIINGSNYETPSSLSWFTCRHWLTDDSQRLKLRNTVKSVVADLSVVTDWLMTVNGSSYETPSSLSWFTCRHWLTEQWQSMAERTTKLVKGGIGSTEWLVSVHVRHPPVNRLTGNATSTGVWGSR